MVSQALDSVIFLLSGNCPDTAVHLAHVLSGLIFWWFFSDVVVSEASRGPLEGQQPGSMISG